MSKSKSKSKKTLFQVGTETNKNISSYLKISASHRPESWAMYNIYNMVKCKNIQFKIKYSFQWKVCKWYKRMLFL